MTEPLAIYIHTPFCRSKCSYCDFNSYAGLTELYPAYADALTAELKSAAEAAAGRPVKTVYFGGGNPALLGAKSIDRLLDTIRRRFALAREAEISVEVNPEDAGLRFLADLRRLGVDRLSLGWQTLDDKRLARLGRRHDSNGAVRSLHNARDAGFDNVSVDMIFGLPGQTERQWADELEAAVSEAPEHLSIYGLTVEAGTKMDEDLRAGRLILPEEDEVAAMYVTASEILKRAGYGHYEISNFALPGRECRHNLNYWTGGDYLGVGAGAHSHIAGRRSWSTAAPVDFIRSAAVGETEAGREELDDLARVRERVFLGLRLASGVDPDDISRQFAVDVRTLFADQIRELRRDGLMRADGLLALTEKGLLLANEAMLNFV